MEKRTPAQLSKHATKIHNVLRRLGHATTEQISEACGLGTEAIRLPLRKLIASKEVKRVGKGKTRATQYAAR